VSTLAYKYDDSSEPGVGSADRQGRGARLISAADEFVIQAVQLLHEQEQWLADNGRDIAAKIEQGFSQAENSELVDEDEAFQTTPATAQAVALRALDTLVAFALLLENQFAIQVNSACVHQVRAVLCLLAVNYYWIA